MVVIDLCEKKRKKGTPKAKIGVGNLYPSTKYKNIVIPPEYENEPDLYMAIMASLED